nr:unnamed protein product [Spirometra erinaceieuropaei]
MSSLEEEEEGRACVTNGFYGCYLLVSVGSRCVFCNTTLVLNAEEPSQRQERDYGIDCSWLSERHICPSV